MQNERVALRKESVDRNWNKPLQMLRVLSSLSARRAWIEICCGAAVIAFLSVALRKESVDRNNFCRLHNNILVMSLSARRAWIEILGVGMSKLIRLYKSLSARRAWIEISEAVSTP